MIIHYHKGKFIPTSGCYIPQQLNDAFVKLIEYIGKDFTDADISASNSIVCRSSFYGNSKIEVKDNELSRILGDLFDASINDINAAYKKGKEDGKKALIMLNNGEMSIKDFDKY